MCLGDGFGVRFGKRKEKGPQIYEPNRVSNLSTVDKNFPPANNCFEFWICERNTTGKERQKRNENFYFQSTNHSINP